MLSLGRDLGFFGFDKVDTVAWGGAGVKHTFDFKYDVCQGDYEFNTIGWLVACPNAAFQIPIGPNYADGVTWAGGIEKVNLTLADGAPPTAFESKRQNIINSMDGYRLCEVLNNLTGLPTIVGLGGLIESFVGSGPANPATTRGDIDNFVTRGEQRRRGRLIDIGPFGASTGAAVANYSDGMGLFLPIGHRRGEQLGEFAIPTRWFTGNAGQKDCKQGGAPGSLDITFKATMDNIAVTYTATVLTLYHCYLAKPRSKTRCPPVMNITANATTDMTIKANRGLRGLFAFMKPLSAGQAMQAHNYSEIKAKLAGVTYEPSLTPEAMTMFSVLSGNTVDNDQFSWPYPAISLPSRATARYSSPGVPVLYNTDSLLDAWGSIDGQPEIEIVTSGETNYEYVDATWTPVTPEVKALANQWAAGQAPVTETVGQNGNAIPQSSPLSRALPAMTRG